MDRRTFLKAMGAVFASIPFNTSGSQQTASPSGNEKAVASPPRFRLIAVGNASVPNVLEYFDSSIPGLHPDEMMYLDKDGLLRRCSGLSDADCCGIEESRLACNRSIGHLDAIRSGLGKSEREIAEFVRDGEWLFIYAVLDNAVAFAASERIARIARGAGVKTIAFVATPYDYTGNTLGYAEEFKYRSEMLGAASRNTRVTPARSSTATKMRLSSGKCSLSAHRSATKAAMQKNCAKIFRLEWMIIWQCAKRRTSRRSNPLRDHST